MDRIDPVERHLFLEGIFMKYGYDFRQYSEASLNRRLQDVVNRNPDKHLLDILKACLESSPVFESVLPLLTIGTTEFFRDPKFFRALRETVIPVLKTYPRLNFWCAGCSTGEEPLSLAILLHEEGLLSRSTIYATEINPVSLKKARDGIYPGHDMRLFARNYAMAGGKASPSDYYIAEYGLVRFSAAIRDKIVYSVHNLATDAAFTEAHLVLCRNVLIYFDKRLQDRSLKLFVDSMAYRGFLAIGTKEAIRFSAVNAAFEPVEKSFNIFQLRPQLKSAPQSIHGERA